jgi:HEAT repeat protein
MGTEICFDGYLNSVVSAYQEWWRLYTLTDATGRESQQVERDRITPAFFDFGLMVQTVELPKAEQERELEGDREKKEKIERLPVLEGICKYAAEHVLLVGRPGSGKSTALARLLLQEAENALSDRNAKIPVLVELRYLPSEANASSVCDRILAFMHKHDPALDIDEAGIKQLLRQGRLLLLVDGVNELPSDRGRVMVNQFRELYQKTCPMIFTTRELSAGGDLGIAKRLEMQPLTEPQMQQFVMAYLPTQGERLLRQLSGRLREFGQTPLLLWMLCSLFQQSEQIPPNLGMVFRAFTVGYGDRIKQDVTLSRDSRAWWGRLLQYLAFKMTCGESLTELQVAISRREAEQFLVEFLRGKVEFADDLAVRWLEDLLKHHLIQISNDRIEFRHQLIQEYYAAEWLLGLLPSLSDARLRQGYLNYLKWTEPLALMLELVDGEEQAVRVVRLALEVDLRFGARLAGAVKYGFQEKTVGLLMREIDRLKILQWEIAQVSVIELLGKTRSDYVIEFLLSELNSFQDRVEIIGKALKEISSDNTFTALNKLLQNQNINWTMRVKSAKILGIIGSEKSIEPLIQSLKDKNSFVRCEVVKALGKISSYKVIKPLIQSLRDKDTFVRLSAIDSLEKIGSHEAIQSLIEITEEHCDSIKYNGLRLKSEKKGEALQILIPNLSDTKYSWSQRQFIARSLGNIGNKIAVEPLIYALQDEHLLHVVAEALGKIGDKGDKKIIEPLIHISYPLIHMPRYHYAIELVVEALGKIGDEMAVEFLIQLIEHKNSAIRERAIIALGEIGNKKAAEPLIQNIRHSLATTNMQILCLSIESLGKIGDDTAAKPIIQLVNGFDYARASAYTLYVYSRMFEFVGDALARMHGEKTVQLLIQNIENDNPVVREVVAFALGVMKKKEAIAPLVRIFYNKQVYRPNARIIAASLLAKIGCDESVFPLVGLLYMERNSVDKKFSSDDLSSSMFQMVSSHDLAAKLLGKIGSEEAVKSIIKSLNLNYCHPEHVAEALKGILGTENAAEAIIKTLHEGDYFISEKMQFPLEEATEKKELEAIKRDATLIRHKISLVLGMLGSEKAIKPLILALNDKDPRMDLKKIAVDVLTQLSMDDRNLPTLTQQLPHLLTLIPTESSQQALSVITAIQTRCKYYNYDIAQTPLQETENHANPVERILQEIHQTIKIMSETGKYNFKAEVVQIVENNSGEVIAKKYANDPALLQTINEITQVLANLQKAHPTATEAEAKDIIEAEFKEIQTNQPNKWTTFRQQLLNPERWLNGGKATISEIAKHYAENNVFLKAGVAFLDGFSTDEE